MMSEPSGESLDEHEQFEVEESEEIEDLGYGDSQEDYTDYRYDYDLY